MIAILLVFICVVIQDSLASLPIPAPIQVHRLSTPYVANRTPPYNDGYYATVGVGCPPKYFNISVDTNTGTEYTVINESPGTTSCTKSFSRYYPGNFPYCFPYCGSEAIWGYTITQIKDQLTLSSSVVIPSVRIDNDQSFLSLGFMQPSANLDISVVKGPSIAQLLCDPGKVVSGLYLPPAAVWRGNVRGSIAFCKPEASKINGTIKYASLYDIIPWDMKVDSITYGNQTLLRRGMYSKGPKDIHGYLNSGQSGDMDRNSGVHAGRFIHLVNETFLLYQKATGAVLDNATKVYTISDAQYHKLKPLGFVINGTTHYVTPDAQILPRSLNYEVSGKKNDTKIYLAVQPDMVSTLDEDTYLYLGRRFMERHYALFDDDNHRVGIAPNIYMNSVVNYPLTL